MIFFRRIIFHCKGVVRGVRQIIFCASACLYRAARRICAQIVASATSTHATNLSPVPAIASPVHAGLHCRGRLICLAAATDSAMSDFSFTMVIINPAVDINWPNISGEIHPVYFILYIAFFKSAITSACKVI